MYFKFLIFCFQLLLGVGTTAGMRCLLSTHKLRSSHGSSWLSHTYFILQISQKNRSLTPDFMIQLTKLTQSFSMIYLSAGFIETVAKHGVDECFCNSYIFPPKGWNEYWSGKKMWLIRYLQCDRVNFGTWKFILLKHETHSHQKGTFSVSQMQNENSLPGLPPEELFSLTFFLEGRENVERFDYSTVQSAASQKGRFRQ